MSETFRTKILDALEPVDLKAFSEASGQIDGWDVTIAKAGEFEASPTWVLPDELDEAAGVFRPFSWRNRVADAADRTRILSESLGLETFDANASFPQDGVGYTITVIAKKAAKKPQEEREEREDSAEGKDTSRALRRLQKRSSGGQ